MAPFAPRIVHEAAQRIVDAGGVEQRQRAGLAFAVLPLAVGDLVADRGQLRRREVAGELGGGHRPAGQRIGALQHVGVGDLLVADRDLDLGAVLGEEGGELLDQIAAKRARVRDGGLVDAGTLQPAESPPVARQRAVGIAMDDTQLWIAKGCPRRWRRRLMVAQIPVERGNERGAGVGIELLQAIHGGFGGSNRSGGALRHVRGGPYLRGWPASRSTLVDKR